ncbi:MAG: response regulator [Pseudanabaena sp. ELA607]
MNKSNFLKKVLGPTPHCFITINRNFQILEMSYGVDRFAEKSTAIIPGNDIRHAFPEIIGLEAAFAEIWYNSGQTLELKGVMRSRSDEMPIYFDLYAVLSGEDQDHKIMFIYLEDVTNIMIKSQNLMQRVNEIELFFSVLSSSKEYIECILTSMADALIVTNQSRRIKIANPAALDLFGYSKDELIYQYIDMLVTDSNQLEILHKNAMQITMSEHNSKDEFANHNRFNLELSCVTKIGKKILIAFSCAQIWIEKEKSYNYIYIGRDVTLIHEKEELLRQAKQQAEYSSQAKSIFLANMSHEIRTPMNGVLGMADLLAETPLTQEQKFLLDGIRLSGNILLDLINDVLDLAKLEAGQEQIAPSIFNIYDSLEEILEIFALRSHQKGLEINSIIDPLIPEYLLGDRHHLRHILINLVGNALKFTTEGNILIKLDLVKLRENQNISIIFSVIDTGIGIPDDAIDHLFKPFSQVDASTTRRFGGTGLGLSICKQLIDLMGGKLGVKKNQHNADSGSHFWFELSFDLTGNHLDNSLNSKITNELAHLETLVKKTNSSLEQSSNILSHSYPSAPSNSQFKLISNRPIITICHTPYSQEALANQLQFHQTPTIKILGNDQTFSVNGNTNYNHEYIVNQLQELQLTSTPLGILIDLDLLIQSSINKLNAKANINSLIITKIKEIPIIGKAPIIAMIRVHQQEYKFALLKAGCSNYLIKPFNRKRIITLLSELLALHLAPQSEPPITSSTTENILLSLEAESLTNSVESDLSSLRVLIAEDNKVNQMVATKQLEKYVAKIDVVPDGQKAIAAWQKQNYDLILMDCQMPLVDGYEAAAIIRQQEREQGIQQPVIIIAMTANAMSEDRDRCLQSGMNDYLSKPLRAGQLKEMLQQWSIRLHQHSAT